MHSAAEEGSTWDIGCVIHAARDEGSIFESLLIWSDVQVVHHWLLLFTYSLFVDCLILYGTYFGHQMYNHIQGNKSSYAGRGHLVYCAAQEDVGIEYPRHSTRIYRQRTSALSKADSRFAGIRISDASRQEEYQTQSDEPHRFGL